MSEASVNILIAVIGVLGSALTVVVVFFTRKALAYLDSKTRFLDGHGEAERKVALQRRAEELVATAVQATQQTFVDGLKAGSGDGKLTAEEAGEAFRRPARGPAI